MSLRVTISHVQLLDPDDPRPTYAQVADALRCEIEQGTLRPGAKLPTHQQLVSRYGVSVGRVKRALGELQGARPTSSLAKGKARIYAPSAAGARRCCRPDRRSSPASSHGSLGARSADAAPGYRS
ncbi:MAG: GntR family transcriptional regulator [Pseudonocardia sp.]